MKQTYYLLILLLISLVSCEKQHIKHYEMDLYFCNELEDNITLEIFKEGEVSKYELTQNTSEGTYHVVIYSRNNVGVFAGIYNINHKHLGDGLVRLQETIEFINKY